MLGYVSRPHTHPRSRPHVCFLLGSVLNGNTRWVWLPTLHDPGPGLAASAHPAPGDACPASLHGSEADGMVLGPAPLQPGPLQGTFDQDTLCPSPQGTSQGSKSQISRDQVGPEMLPVSSHFCGPARGHRTFSTSHPVYTEDTGWQSPGPSQPVLPAMSLPGHLSWPSVPGQDGHMASPGAAGTVPMIPSSASWT